MSRKPQAGWWARKLWIVVVFPCFAAVLLAGVAVFKGWLHQFVGFDSEGQPLAKSAPIVTDRKADALPLHSRVPVPAVDAYRRIVTDLQQQRTEARAKVRYLTLLHCYSEPTCADADLQGLRQAVRDLVGRLSRNGAPNASFIDPEQILFRIDLEELGWDTATDWHKVLSQYRYGLRAEGKGPLAILQQQAEQLTQDLIPVVRSDWFIFALTGPPLAKANGFARVSLNDLSESIRTVRRKYAVQTLDLAACARELGLSEEKRLTDLIGGHTKLQQEFGLAALLRGERIRRDWWESEQNFLSPYQELARLLNLGEPIQVQ